MKPSFAHFLSGLLLAVVMILRVQAADEFPGMPVSAEMLRTQEKAQQLFEAGNYKRAYFIYRNELAPVGDKHSQYMIGFMHLAGKGVSKDGIVASAWYRLAAERGTPEFVKARDKVLAALTAEQKAASDREYIALRQDLADVALLFKAVRSDYSKLAQPDARLRTSPEREVSVGAGAERREAGPLSNEDRALIRKRLQQRLDFILDESRIEVANRDIDSLDLAVIETRVKAYLETAD